MTSSVCLMGLEMGVNIVCTLKTDGKHDLLTFSQRTKNKTQLSLSRRVREVADDVS